MKYIVFFILVFTLAVCSSAQNVFNPTGNVGIGTASPGSLLTVNGHAALGDSYDPTAYGIVQIVRPVTQPENQFHLAFIRAGNSVSGIGYAPNSNIFGIWHGNSNLGVPVLAFTPSQQIGIGTSTPRSKVDLWGGDLLVTGTDLSGTAVVTSRAGISYFASNAYRMELR